MRVSESTIEAEIVEIDGVAVEPRPVRTSRSGKTRVDWRMWQNRAMKLDSRWWPLWLVLGFTLLVIAVALGMCALVIFVFYKLAIVLGQTILSLFQPPASHLRSR